MINYSIYPADVVFNEWDETELKYEEFTTSEGIILQVRRLNDNNVKIDRVISSNPEIYLRNDLAPGCILKNSLQL